MAWQEDLGSHQAIPFWHCSMAPNISDHWMLQAYPCNCWVARTRWGRHSVSTTPQMWLKLAHQTQNKHTNLDQRQMVSLWDRYPVSPCNLSLSEVSHFQTCTPPFSIDAVCVCVCACVGPISRLSFRCGSENVAGLSRLPKWFQQKKLQEQHCRHIAIASESEAAGHCSPLTLRKDAFKSSELWVPFSLEALVARMASPDKVVVLSVVGNSYRDLLMSWVCGLHHLNISNFVVFALDDELYQFAVLQVCTDSRFHA